MIIHTDLGSLQFARSRKLLELIREGTITFAGNKRLKIYGTLTCASGKRMKVENRVFFSGKNEAKALGYRPCGHCMKAEYFQWKNKKMSILSDASNLLPFDGTAYLVPDAFSLEESEEYLAALQYDITWRQEPIKIFGKEVLQPRFTAWYGDEDKVYTYSGITMKPLLWTNTLIKIKEKVEQITTHKFNSVLLNFYRNGQDSMGWHRDNEKELGADPVIASVSFGVTRKFQFRYYKDHNSVISLELGSGSLLLMSGSTQSHWQHRLPKSSMVQGARINLTFRDIKS